MSSATPGTSPTPDPSSVTPRVQAIIQALARPSTTESQYVLQTRLTSDQFRNSSQTCSQAFQTGRLLVCTWN
jgi:hypothetical protein